LSSSLAACEGRPFEDFCRCFFVGVCFIWLQLLSALFERHFHQFSFHDYQIFAIGRSRVAGRLLPSAASVLHPAPRGLRHAHFHTAPSTLVTVLRKAPVCVATRVACVRRPAVFPLP